MATVQGRGSSKKVKDIVGSGPDDRVGRRVTRSGRTAVLTPQGLLGSDEPLFIMNTNRRGGCGKTTNSVALAQSLAYRGYNVLFVSASHVADLHTTQQCLMQSSPRCMCCL